MNRKIEWIINQNRDGQTEPWIKLRYADAAKLLYISSGCSKIQVQSQNRGESDGIAA